MAGASAAVFAKIQENDRAAAALATTLQQAQEQRQGGGWRPGMPKAPEPADGAGG